MPGQVIVAEIRLAKRALPEAALCFAGVLPGQNHRHGDFLVDEIIAGILPITLRKRCNPARHL